MVKAWIFEGAPFIQEGVDEIIEGIKKRKCGPQTHNGNDVEEVVENGPTNNGDGKEGPEPLEAKLNKLERNMNDSLCLRCTKDPKLRYYS